MSTEDIESGSSCDSEDEDSEVVMLVFRQHVSIVVTPGRRVRASARLFHFSTTNHNSNMLPKPIQPSLLFLSSHQPAPLPCPRGPTS
jgi:hypothetical protein